MVPGSGHSAALEARLESRERQLLQMQHMLSQIMERIVPMPAAAAPSSGEVPDTDPDSYMTSGVDGGELNIHNLFS